MFTAECIDIIETHYEENTDWYHNNFEKVCFHALNNYIFPVAQWCLDKPSKTKINLDNVFGYLCQHGNLKAAQWLYKEYSEINVEHRNNFAFRYACIYGHVETAKWLYDVKPSMDISIYYDDAYRNAILNDRMDVVVWLHSLDKSFDITYSNYLLFTNLCTNLKINMAKYLYSYYPNTEINFKDIFAYLSFDKTIQDSPEKVIELFDWLLSLEKDKMLQSLNESKVFESACSCQNTLLLKWLHKNNVFNNMLDDKFENGLEKLYQNLGVTCFLGGTTTKFYETFDFFINYTPHLFLKQIDDLYCKLYTDFFTRSMNTSKSEERTEEYFNIIHLLEKHKSIDYTKFTKQIIKTISFYTRSLQHECLELLKKIYAFDNSIIFPKEIFSKAFSHNFFQIAVWLCEKYPQLVQAEFNTDTKDIIQYSIQTIFFIGTIKESNIEQCPICQEVACNLKTKCNHGFCTECLNNWFEYKDENNEFSCPTCRQDVDMHALYKIEAI